MNCLFILSVQAVTSVSHYEDGEIKYILNKHNNKPITKIIFKRLQDTNYLLREKVTYNYNSGWKCHLIENYKVSPDVPVEKRSHLLHIEMISKAYCNENGKVVVKDYFRKKDSKDTIIYKREFFKNNKLKQSFEILFKNNIVSGFKEFLDGQTFHYSTSENKILRSVSYLNPEDIKVMVIDSGLDFSHSTFDQRIVLNNMEIPNNGIDDDGNGFIDDSYSLDLEEKDGHAQEIVKSIDELSRGVNDKKFEHKSIFPNFHGTHVAGIVIDNSVSAKVFPVRGDYLTYKFWGQIDNYLDASQFDVLNMSAGILIRTRDPEYPRFNGLESTIDRHRETLFVFPSGNEGLDVDNMGAYFKVVPARYSSKNMIIVAALAKENKNKLADFSNYGIYSVDVAAPGQDINAARPGNSYIRHSGTSMASPMVAGVASDIKSILIKSEWGEHYRFSNEMTMLIKEIIMVTVDINFKNPLPVRSGGAVNPELAKELAFLLSSKDFLPNTNDVYEGLKFLIDKTDFTNRMQLWKKRGGLF